MVRMCLSAEGARQARPSRRICQEGAERCVPSAEGARHDKERQARGAQCSTRQDKTDDETDRTSKARQDTKNP